MLGKDPTIISSIIFPLGLRMDPNPPPSKIMHLSGQENEIPGRGYFIEEMLYFPLCLFSFEERGTWYLVFGRQTPNPQEIH